MYAHQVFVLINTATTGISTLSYTTLFRSHLGAPAELVVRLARRSEDGGRVVGHPGNAEHRLIDDGDRPRIDDAGRTLVLRADRRLDGELTPPEGAVGGRDEGDRAVALRRGGPGRGGGLGRGKRRRDLRSRRDEDVGGGGGVPEEPHRSRGVFTGLAHHAQQGHDHVEGGALRGVDEAGPED